ncbi:MAG: hypothetical protein F6K58_17005 [Symploca sp. SIO2E9]|nr:hypothetical protein [Symploca sp. SIO2E9]
MTTGSSLINAKGKVKVVKTVVDINTAGSKILLRGKLFIISLRQGYCDHSTTALGSMGNRNLGLARQTAKT